MKKCITVGASALLLFPLGDQAAFKHEAQNLDEESVDVKDVKPSAAGGEQKNRILNRKIFVSQVAAAVAALHERSLLEQKIKGFWFSQQPSNYQLYVVFTLQNLSIFLSQMLIWYENYEV